MDSDDEIELLKQPHSGESDVTGKYNQQQPQVNPAFSFQSRSSVDDNSKIDPASYHALQAAVSSLKKKCNDQGKKIQELQRQRRSNFGSTNLDEKGMDPVQGHNQTVGVGAGASQDDEGYNAEIRAKQGYIQHLERELLRSNNNLSKGNVEIERLKKQMTEYQSSEQTWDRERQQLKEHVEELSQRLQQSMLETDQRTQHLEEALKSVTLQNERLSDQVAESKRHLESTDRISTDLRTKENELQEFASRIKVLENEKSNLIKQLRDLENCLKDKDREISALEAKHKQYVIENKIQDDRKTAQTQIERGSDIDNVDGFLQTAVDMIKHHQTDMQELKHKVEQQKILIKELTNFRYKQIDNSIPVKDIEEREAAQGASFHPQMKDENPIYMNTSPRIRPSQSSSPNLIQSSSLMRASSDRGDYRGIGSGSPNISPRINDSVKPTGNTHVPRMIATEQQQTLIACGPDRNNVFDASRIKGMSSPRGLGNITDPSNAQVFGYPDEENRNTSPRPVRVFEHETSHPPVSEYNTSPRPLREQIPNSEETSVLNMPQSANFRNARIRPHMISDMNQSDLRESNTTLINSRLIPDRMTQSEIIVRDTSPRNTDNVVPRLDLTGSIMSRSQENIHPQGQTGETYLQDTNRFQAGGLATNTEIKREHPNYENIYEHRETESPESRYDHSVYVNDPNVLMSNRQPVQSEEQVNSVSALKICPVCNAEFSRLTMDQFQTHVFECFDNNEEPPATIQPEAENPLSDDRTCPMCGATYPMTVPQEAYEQHVLAHFGEEPLIERYEVLNN